MNRRSFIRGLIVAPAVVAASSLMPVRSIERLLIAPIMTPVFWYRTTPDGEWMPVMTRRGADAFSWISTTPLILKDTLMGAINQ